jgi:hypothetical protein
VVVVVVVVVERGWVYGMEELVEEGKEKDGWRKKASVCKLWRGVSM